MLDFFNMLILGTGVSIFCVHVYVFLYYSMYSYGFSDSGTSGPRAVWTPSSQQARQENLCTAEELVSSSNNLDTSNNNSSSSATLHNTGLMSSNSSTSWWQQQALQVKTFMKQEGKGQTVQYTYLPNAFFVNLYT
jgi:hypothetical protein